MNIRHSPFETVNWREVEPVTYPGETGTAIWRTRYLGDIRVRMVEYSAGYLADHWCDKGHVLLCLEGELHTHMHGGSVSILRPGMSYEVGDQSEAHRSSAPDGAKLFIVD